MKKLPKVKTLDLAHRGVVISCIGLTLYGSWLLGHKVYRYFTIIKPRREEEELRIIQELNTMDASALVDKAKPLSS